MIGYQFLTGQQVIGTQTHGVGFLAVGAFALRLLHPCFPALARHYRHDRGVDVRCVLVHVKHCRYGVFLSERAVQPLQVIIAPSSSLPSSCTLTMSSCVPESTMRIARTWSGVIFRLMPAVRMRWLIASVRSATPSGNSTSSRLRWVRVGSAFLGMVLRSIWSDAPVSADPFALFLSRISSPQP